MRFIALKILLAALALTPELLHGTEPKQEVCNFKALHFGKEDGLPGASVNVILQDDDGYLWIGTGAGLLRFNGVKFTRVDLLDPLELRPASVTALVNRASRLWVGTQHGLYCISRGKTTCYGPADGLLDAEITCLTADVSGRIWIGTPQGVSLWDGLHFQSFTKREGLPENQVSRIYIAHSGAVWITTPGGICSYAGGRRMTPMEFRPDRQGGLTKYLGVFEDVRQNFWAYGTTYLINLTKGRRFNYFHGQESVKSQVWSLCEGRDGRVWVGTSERGLFAFDGTRFQPVTYCEGQGPNNVVSICEDKEGDLWVGSLDGSLTRLQPQPFTLFKGEQGLPTGPARCLAFDRNGRVQVGLDQGGLMVDVGQRLDRFSDFGGWVGQGAIAALCTGLDGSLWIASPETGLGRVKDGRYMQLTTANGLMDDGVLAVCSDKEGTIWVGTKAGALHRWEESGVTRLSATDGLAGTPITVIAAAQAGGVWVGTGSGAVLRGETKKLQRINLPAPLGGNPILSLYEDSGGRLWAGNAVGLGCLTPGRTGCWKILDDLSGSAVSGVVDDTDHNLWLVTGKGVCRIESNSVARALAGQESPKPKLVFETPASRNQGTRFGGACALRSTEGRLWFATGAGLLTVDPREWKPASPVPPPVYLDAVLVNDRPVYFGSAGQSQSGLKRVGPLKLPVESQGIEFQFTGLNFSAPELVRYRHRLEGFDSDWVQGADPFVRYGRLPPGRYQFTVTARSGDGGWNASGASVVFIVPPSFWRTPWVMAICALLGTGGVAGIGVLMVHRRLRRRLAQLKQQEAMERDRVRIAKNMHDEIGSKLTKISFMSERAKVELKEAKPVEGLIDAIAQTSRKLLQSLDEMVWAVNPRNDTLEHLADYLAQYGSEYFTDTPIECELQLSGTLPPLMMSSETRHNLFLAFEEALNNVLKHSGGTCVQIQMSHRDGGFHISVHDNGHGFDSETPRTTGFPVRSGIAGGNGLGNMRDRLTSIGGRCEIESRPGSGTTVHLSIPVNSTKLKPS